MFHDRLESSVAAAEAGEEEAPEEGTDDGFDDYRGNDTDDASDDEDIDEDGDVEYTLKDRQDAINVEHPFGLPIWKPALYKKSRSITRNAETALHATPSSTALRHLAPGNILWTIFFGSWLCLVCAIIAAILWCTPFGGEKYGRVIWELGGYIFWPFGKYVEGWTDGDDYEHEDEEDEERTPQDDGDATPGPQSRLLDVEDGGRTFSRGRNASNASGYGSTPPGGDKSPRSSSEDTIAGVHRVPSWRPHNFHKDDHHSFRVRALGRVMYWVGFYLVVAPLMLLACILCWGMVFTIPMAKLLWVLIRHLNNEPLSLHFRSPPKYSTTSPDQSLDDDSAQPTSAIDGIQYPLRPGQPAPRVSPKQVDSARRHGRLTGPHSTVLLCTYRAAGLQYYKYTIDGVNIMFINLMSLVVFVIADFFLLEPYVEHHHLGGLLAFVSGQGFIFVAALLSVIPLSYFIGMAVASISAQSSIGMGAVINASFGSIIEIILYGIALTQGKANLVEGSIVGSILAGVLLMPGASMIGGAMRRKEQKFNARSAGVTSTMLIMAIIGILTPTMFYEIYGSFQLTCTGCDLNSPRGTESCSTCYYEHVDPADDPFYKQTVKQLAYYCAILLVLSYLIGLWFSLRTHASQIWQNAQHVKAEEGLPRPTTASTPADRTSMYKRVIPNQLLPKQRHGSSTGARTPTGTTPLITPRPQSKVDLPPAMELPHGMTAEDLSRAFEVVAATASAMRRSSESHPSAQQAHGKPSAAAPQLHRQSSHVRETSNTNTVKVEQEGGGGGEEGHGGHDAPNWSRAKSASVLMGCTVLYAIIAEILVDVVDVVLDGSGIPEKFLGVTLFALVPNTTEFMNAISFAINGNIALSMEIGSAYALQVCLIQAPAMLAFSAFYAIGKDSLLHHAFTLVFPRWDVIAIMFSVFLLTYTYIEARANYYRGTILCLSYLVLMGGFAWAPDGRDSELSCFSPSRLPLFPPLTSLPPLPTASDNPGFTLLQTVEVPSAFTLWQQVQALALFLFTR
ncbi:hypothetical protein BCR35DRAFT_269927 [Leucosporidium creatinivorum]|uniref:Sodium/calcium exchanger protein-domain-containing protein n=2 Tax=Leucosporidium creatinivorum TaxID=106004 RepID=A0A1Y2E9Z7_9BASI|nr:hypothetical protein BCR35DRAFT_269927 [Leucosporidium creatinivorum]